MSLPEFPPQHHRPSYNQVLIDLLESIALEETALAHILNAEAEKIQKFIHTTSGCTPPHVLIDFNTTVNETLETVIMKEWLLLRKLEKVVRLMVKHMKPSHHPCECESCKPSCKPPYNPPSHCCT